MKKRVVVLGAAGFVGSHIVKTLSPDVYEPVAVTRRDCDFTDAQCRGVIGNIVRDGDVVVCAAARAPAKNIEMLNENVAIITNIAEALKGKRLAYLLNVSSDAVYADAPAPEKLSEASSIAPQGAHGAMHCLREYILEKTVAAPIGHLRPTLIYGEDDPHNGYGPNAFLRAAREGRNIELFGKGEERRDHIFVGDVARLANSMIENNTTGAVNAVTGKVISFMEIAEMIKSAAKSPVEILSRPRSGPMPHNGWRAFDNSAARAVNPSLRFTGIEEYIQHAMSA